MVNANNGAQSKKSPSFARMHKAEPYASKPPLIGGGGGDED